MRWVVAAGIVLATSGWAGRAALEQRRITVAAGPAEKAREAPPREEEERAIAFGGEVPPEAPPDEEAHAVPVEGDLEIYVVRAARPGRAAPVVFLTGSCTHPLTYVKAFRHAGAEHGGLVALQGDLPCKGDPTLRRWSA